MPRFVNFMPTVKIFQGTHKCCVAIVNFAVEHELKFTSAFMHFLRMMRVIINSSKKNLNKLGCFPALFHNNPSKIYYFDGTQFRYWAGKIVLDKGKGKIASKPFLCPSYALGNTLSYALPNIHCYMNTAY